MMSRMRFAMKIASGHFFVSLLIATIVAYFIFFVWYPYPIRGVMGGNKLFLLLIGVDFICGPALTLLLANPLKSRWALVIDLSLVVFIQLSALVYGLYHVVEARPVVVVFEADRLRVLAPKDIDIKELDKAPEGYRKLPLFGYWMLGTRQSKNGEDTMDAIFQSFSGFDIGQRPSWWISYSEDLPRIKKRSLPLADIEGKLSDREHDILEQALISSGEHSDNIFFLPMTSAYSNQWTALLNQNMQLIGAAPLDGFKLEQIAMPKKH